MRVNIYAEEMTDRVEIVSKEIEGNTYTGLRVYLELPVTFPGSTASSRTSFQVPTDPMPDGTLPYLKGPFIHRPGDDDSAAITFWGKRDLRDVLRKMLAELDAHYGAGAAIDTGVVARQLPQALDEDLIDILGRPNFLCAGIASILRQGGQEIKFKAEHEQAAAIHFLLKRYLEHGAAWADRAQEELNAMVPAIQQGTDNA